MHIHCLNDWQHSNRFNADDTHGERNTKRVILLTLFMMVIEISAGYLYGSMALLADGWHMGTHAVALGITVFAYYYARRHSDNPDYSFGTGKVGVLGGFASAVVHVWRVGPHHLSVIISIVTHFPKSPEYYKNLLSAYDEINHVTVEVNKCEGEPCIIPNPQLI
jgi:Co/Zn/Cd efflux system component